MLFPSSVLAISGLRAKDLTTLPRRFSLRSQIKQEMFYVKELQKSTCLLNSMSTLRIHKDERCYAIERCKAIRSDTVFSHEHERVISLEHEAWGKRTHISLMYPDIHDKSPENDTKTAKCVNFSVVTERGTLWHANYPSAVEEITDKTNGPLAPQITPRPRWPRCDLWRQQNILVPSCNK